jgi:nicotinamidase/pyrazinamidase
MSAQQRSTDIVFWDVDTQFDFMTPAEQGGKLYVKDPGDESDPGAQRIVPQLESLSRYAREHGIPRVATGDWHSPGHREIDAESPDFRSTYPPHCMAGERGSEKIPETELRDPITIPLRAPDEAAREAARRAREEHRDIFVQKEEFSCFTGNAATDALIRELDAGAFVVYGVALDVCVRHAVEGMLERGERVYVVEDATWGLGLEDREELLRGWERRGARRVSTRQVVEHFPPRLPESAESA